VLRDEKGLSLVLVAIILFSACAVMALVVDISYRHIAKNELQKAADAAALAGAAEFINPMLPPVPGEPLVAVPLAEQDLLDARTQAVRFALENVATKIPVQIFNSGGSELTPDNDVRVGRWSGGSFTATLDPALVNAIQVRTRRTADAKGGQGEVALFLSKFTGWDSMPVSAVAVAGLPFGMSRSFAFCNAIDPTTLSQSLCGLSEPRVMTAQQGAPHETSFAWTSLLSQDTSARTVRDFICQETADDNACNQEVYTTNGENLSILRDFESVFYNPTYDARHKEITDGVVTAWWLVVPITDDCPPGAQGTDADPKWVTQFAWVRVRAVCTGTGGTGCGGHNAPPNACDAYPSQTMVVDRVNCFPCSAFPANTLGRTARLLD